MWSLSVIAASMAIANAKQHQNSATEHYLEELNTSLIHNFLWSLLTLTVVALAYKSVCRVFAHMRQLASLTNGTSQRYFSLASPSISWLKDHVLFAPL